MDPEHETFMLNVEHEGRQRTIPPPFGEFDALAAGKMIAPFL